MNNTIVIIAISIDVVPITKATMEAGNLKIS